MSYSPRGTLATKDCFQVKASLRLMAFWGALGTAALLSGCLGGGSSSEGSTSSVTQLSCDLNSIQNGFKPDANTTVIAVRNIQKGETITAVDSGTPITMANNTCLVKLLVGPGNTTEPATAPSYSTGIGMEIWLPAKDVWNERIRDYGGGGWVGGGHRYADKIGSKVPALINANMGYAVSTHDAGQPLYQDGSFVLKADGTINQTLLKDFYDRSVYEQAVKTKALVKAYYGKEQKYAYYDGHSQGGRQGWKIAQEYPDLYDGYLLAAPAINNWGQGIGAFHPQIVMKTDLGINALDNPTEATAFNNKLTAVKKLAMASCDAEALGFLIDPFQCSYNPAKKAEALCSGEAGEGGIVGTNASGTCVTLVEANAINKIWYGATVDGSFDANETYDSRSGKFIASKRLWWTRPIGSSLGGITSPSNTDYLALVNQDTALATSMAAAYTSASKAFVNVSTTERDKWRTFTYADLADSFNKIYWLESSNGNPATDNTDLTRLRNLNRKVVMYGGLADNAIPAASWVYYYTRVANGMGGDAEVQKFFRMYLVPGLAHSSTGAAATSTAGFISYPNNTTVPLPMLPGASNQTPTEEGDQMFTALKNWVEKGTAPGEINIYSSDKSVGYPICVYPRKITWDGVGSSKLPASYSCK